MHRNCKADESIERVEYDGFTFPLGVYPIEEMQPKPGYASAFEPADGSNEDDGTGGETGEADMEHWPDRYVYDVVVSASRVEALVIHLLGMMPLRVYPILDYIGHDAYREIDPYISYELCGLDHVLDAVTRCRDFFFEDGMCGFGALAEDPFFYLFVDEHKIVTIRVAPEMQQRVEKVLEAFDLEEVPEPAGADSAAHEHRGVLVAPGDDPGLLTTEEIVERLRDIWHLTLNIDPTSNLDDGGRDLGATPWRCLVHWHGDNGTPDAYGEVLLVADCLAQAEELAFDAATALADRRREYAELTPDARLVAADRMTVEQFREILERHRAATRGSRGAKATPAKGSASTLIRKGPSVVSAVWL
ncbi:MAG: hypothetical protein AAGI17_01360 [Planctomycetota bacterium]